MNKNPMHYQVKGAFQPMDGNVKAFCQRYMNYHVMAEMNDGSQFDGIIESIEGDDVIMLVPEEVDAEQLRQFNEDGTARQFDFDFDDYDDFDDYGRPRRRRFRRFRRRRFPFRFFSRLFLFPHFYPYYPYYPGY